MCTDNLSAWNFYWISFGELCPLCVCECEQKNLPRRESSEFSKFSPPKRQRQSFNLMKIKMSCTMNKFLFGEIFSPSLIARLYRFLLCWFTLARTRDGEHKWRRRHGEIIRRSDGDSLMLNLKKLSQMTFVVILNYHESPSISIQPIKFDFKPLTPQNLAFQMRLTIVFALF